MQISRQIVDMLSFAVNIGASDVHLSAGLPPFVRLHGAVRRLDQAPVEAEALAAWAAEALDVSKRQQLDALGACDFIVEERSVGRFRTNVFRQYRGISAVFRYIPPHPPQLEHLKNCPAIAVDIVHRKQGLVLITGAAGAGKSTLLASILDRVNTTLQAHILTVEDPIEFIHASKKSLVHQREIGGHTDTFSGALRSALREDPDIILIGELRDLDTIRLALSAAETGHLILATLHTSSATAAIDRIIDVFPAADKPTARALLSQSLQIIIFQTLIKMAHSAGRVAAHEVVVATPAIRHLIRENQTPQIEALIQTGQQFGMQTLRQSLEQLVRQNLISSAEARLATAHR